MKLLFLAAILVLGLCIDPMPNIGYISYGYSVYKGNPHTTTSGVDPGFTNQIFTVDYKTGKTTDDREYLVPDNMTAIREEAANVDFGTEQMTGMQKYTESLSQEFGISLEGYGAKFSMSVDYSKVKEVTSSKKTVFSFSKGFVQVYRAQIGLGIPPRLSEDFLSYSDRLPETYDPALYTELIDSYGTHFITEIHMGARFATQSALSEESYNSMVKQKIKISVAASASAYGITAMADHRTEQEKSWAKEYDNKKEHSSINTIGMKPLQNKTVIEWMQLAEKSPMPMRYKIASIDKLFNPVNFYHRYTDTRMDRLRNNVQLALKNYCESLRNRGLIATCTDPGPDPPMPEPLATCRYCFECGSDYPIQGGTIAAPQHSVLQYDFACKDPYAEKFGMPTLCCEANGENRSGNCRYCSSCGAEFSTRSSALRDPAMKFYNFARDCSGKLEFRGDHDVSLCCNTREPACTICETCGGSWPSEVGSMKKALLPSMTFEGRGRGCIGDVHVLTDPDPKYLCCKRRVA